MKIEPEEHSFAFPAPEDHTITCTKCGKEFHPAFTTVEEIKDDPCYGFTRDLRPKPINRRYK